MADVVVCMPWRATPTRLPPFEKVTRFWQEAGYAVVTADSDPGKPFNRAQARNRAVAAAQSDIVIVTDADTIPPLSVVEEVVATVQGDVVWPSRSRKYISHDWEGDPFTAPVVQLGDEMPFQPAGGYDTSSGGIMVLRTETWWRLGGQDERFTRWGGEDTAFVAAAATLAGGRSVPGLCVSFDHSLDGDVRSKTVLPEFKHLQMLYKNADGDPKAMEKLVSDPARGVVSRGVDEWKAKWPSPPPGINWIPGV